MTKLDEYFRAMRDRGFHTRSMYQAKEIGCSSQHPNIEGRTVYGPDGQFLAIAVFREFEGKVFVHFAPDTADQLQPILDELPNDGE